MEYKVLIRPEAEKDLSEAFKWYEDKRQSLGQDFLLRVEAGLRFIAKNPLLSAQSYKGIRIQFIKRFPYKIIYLFTDNFIIVLGVIHGRRGPRVLQQRIAGL